jgi:hypothetical protein
MGKYADMKMNRDILRDHALEVHDLLTEYIRLHNSLLKTDDARLYHEVIIYET